MQTQTVRINDFSNGLNTKLPASRIQPSEAVAVFNIRTIGGALYPRKDNVDFGTISGGLPVHSMAIFTKSSGERTILAGCGNGIYEKELVASPWWTEGNDWQYRIPIYISNNSNINEIDYCFFVKLPIDFDYTIMNTSGDDLRFVDNNTSLQYYINKWGYGIQPAIASVIAVKVSIPAQSNKTIWMYFGNPVALAESSRQGTFVINDDFSTDPFTEPARMIKEGSGSVTWENSYILGSKAKAYCNVVDKTNAYVQARMSYNFEEYTARIPIETAGEGGGYVGYGLHTCGTIYLTKNNYGCSVTFGGGYNNLTIDCNDKVSVSVALPSLVQGQWYTLRVKWGMGKITASLFPDNQPIGDENNALATVTMDNVPLVIINRIGGSWSFQPQGFDDFIVIGYNQDVLFHGIGNIEEKMSGSFWILQKTLTSSSPWSAALIEDGVANAKKIVIANKEYCYTWDGNNWITWDTTHGLNRAVKHLSAHKGRLFAANAPGEQSRLFYCNVNSQGETVFELTNDWKTNDPDIGGGSSWIDNFEDIDSGQGSEITGIVPSMFDSLLVLKDTGITLFYGSSPSNWGEKKLAYPFGCIAPRSVVKYEDTVFFVSTIGIHYLAGESGHTEAFTFDNIKANSLSESIEPTLFLQDLPSAIGAVWDNKYYLFFPTTKICLVLDWRRKSWWIDISDVGITAAITDGKANQLYIGDSQGKVWRYESGNVMPINLWQSGILRIMPGMETRIREIIVSLKGTATLEIKTDRTNWNTTAWKKTISSDLTTGFYQKRIACNIVGEQIEFKISNLTDKFEGVEMSVIPLRRV